MLKSIQTLLEKKIDGPINDGKTSLKEESNKGVTRIKSKLPSEESLKSKFNSSLSCNIKTQDQIKKDFKSIKTKLEGYNKIVENSKKSIKKIESKIKNIIDNVIPRIRQIFEVLEKIIKVLKILIQFLPLVLRQPAQFVTIGVIIMLHQSIELAKSKVEEFLAGIKAFIQGMKKKMNEAEKMLNIFPPAIKALDDMINKIKYLIELLELLYLKHISKCSSQISDSPTINTNQLPYPPTGVQDPPGGMTYPELLEEGNELLYRLQSQGEGEFIEKVYDADLKLIGYQRFSSS